MIADAVAWVLVLAVAAYACGGGADYGAGFWDLLAGGARRGNRPRALIDHAVAPVWEVNNVWLVFVLVVMWTGFPVMFQAVFSVLWLPLTLAAMGLVLRGAGFALRKPTRRLAERRLFGAAFAVASVLTPYFFGAAVGGVASGRVAPGGSASVSAWTNPTSVLTGLMTVAAAAFLGAVFLSGDARAYGTPDLVDYFRRRALITLLALAVLAGIGIVLTRDDAPYVHERLTGGPGLALVCVAGVCALAAAWLLVRGAPTQFTRAAAVGSVGAVVVAWGLAQRPYLLPTSLTVAEGAGARATMGWLVIVSLVAVVLVGPALVLLYRLESRGELLPDPLLSEGPEDSTGTER
ncbi:MULTISPECIES: cytochrome d ubiquinol oxidase subunit II [unclassified Streptomyces]|uniref:cytochrome d ubiquinol oxidase subunit II n=1 Tax=unclassified Streptomyces TaxID=2593676 RepID=UPI001F036E6F|nr:MULTISPECIES: cytochrome d ubiquinol oxidase subunit II [unclassified Streptomyces]MCH0561913.1 cytochrome d ubiquinol oxidase subunit II [Streptomyces sp. MUM 2J]MCH0568774.1 cytochrome d ubiquinol oxidase subunit II [Streptomyces sp. MUM 136J]